MALSTKLVPLLLAVATGFAYAQTTQPSPPATTAPATQDSGLKAQDSPSPEARDLLQMLQDRKKTLKDFTAKINDSVQHVTGDSDGFTGTCDYIDDPATGGVKLSAHFTADTDDSGKPVITHERLFLLDSKAFTMMDFKAKEFKQQKAPPDKPFDPNSLDSPLPVPIGLKVDEVVKNFTVTLLPAGANPDQPTLRLIPRQLGHYDFKQIDLTIDKKLQLPVKVVIKANGATAKSAGDVTTLKFTDPQINTGKAKIPEAAPPKATDPNGKGWTVEIK